MARRKSKKVRRSTRKTFNLASLAESALIANAVTTGFFNCSLNDFIRSPDGGAGVAGLNVITGRELLTGITGGSYGTTKTQKVASFNGRDPYTMTMGSSFGATVRENLSDNGGMMIGSLILIPFGFRAFSKLTSKPRSTLNKALKMGGLPLKV